MRFYVLSRCLMLATPILLAACTTTELSSEADAPRTVPTEVVTDADRRAIYNSNGQPRATVTNSAIPDATPNTQRLGEQASDINRVKRPESLNTNDPNTSTSETRLRRIDSAIPDTLRRP